MEYDFSVLISVYYKENPEHFQKAMESILNQELKPNEIILIEDGPLTTELYKKINMFLCKNKNIKLIKLKKNMGLGEALRVGVINCSNELIARMDTDDIARTNRFKEQIEVFKNNYNIDVVGTLMDEFKEVDGEIKILNVKVVPENNEDIIKKLKFSNALNHPTVMFKKSKVLLAGNYDEEFNKLEDYYLWGRMALNNSVFYNIQKSLLYFRITEETSKRRSGLKMFLGDFKLHKYFFKNKFINFYEFIRNISIWGCYRFLPYKLMYKIKKILKI